MLDSFHFLFRSELYTQCTSLIQNQSKDREWDFYRVPIAYECYNVINVPTQTFPVLKSLCDVIADMYL